MTGQPFVARMGRPPRLYSYMGEELSLPEIAEKTGFSRTGMYYRAQQYDHDLCAALATERRPSNIVTHDGRTQTLAEWSRETGIHRTTLFARLKNGWTPAEALTVPPGSSRQKTVRP